jgi:glycosyltransferase involved in cell wall biosynthesis
VAGPAQIVVVDDNSTDETAQVARALGTRYLRVSFGDPSSTRNAGLELVSTPYVTFLDDDDEWLPGNMEPQLGALERNPEAAF